MSTVSAASFRMALIMRVVLLRGLEVLRTVGWVMALSRSVVGLFLCSLPFTFQEVAIGEWWLRRCLGTLVYLVPRGNLGCLWCSWRRMVLFCRLAIRLGPSVGG